MNHALLDFIKAWSSHQSAERILEEGPALPNEQDAIAFLQTLPPEEQERIASILNEAVTAFKHYGLELKALQADIKEQLNQNTKVSQACLSYVRTPQKPVINNNE